MAKQPDLPPLGVGQAGILFFTEGNPVAVLVIRKAGRRSTRTVRFDQAETALAWCRGQGAVMVYCPACLDRN
jgi:hypothetical protein